MSVASDGTIIPFWRFIELVRAAEASAYLNRPDSVILDEASFEEMRSYILRYYDQVTPVASFADAGGSVFDCIAVEQQIALRGQSALVAAPPNPPAGVQASGTAPPPQSGNAASAPPGTVPVRRVTLEELMRFPTLAHFLKKIPLSHGKP
jgi:hypothetical protein